jgi:hypothetical protein
VEKKGIYLILTLTLAACAFVIGEKIKQPIEFNHKIHADNDLECLDCHPYYKDHASSGRPALESCAACHEEPLGDSEAEKEVVRHIQEGTEIEWRRLFTVPEDVYFSHKRHVVLGEIPCKTCHGNIGESQSPPRNPKQLSMKRCMKCHREKGVDNDCISCHR